jgi:hypothetical protein
MKIMYLKKTEWTSLYIPSIDSSYSKTLLVYLFEIKYSIGKVKSIDIVKSVTNKADDFSVFVHFDYWYYNKFTNYLRKYLHSHSKYNINKYGKYYPLPDNECADEFVIMKHYYSYKSESERSRDEEKSDIIMRLEKRIELLEQQVEILCNMVLNTKA